MDLNLGEAQRGTIVLNAGKLRQQILVGLADVPPAARVEKCLGAANLPLHRSAWKLLAENGLEIRNTLHGNFRFIIYREAINEFEIIVGCGNGLLAFGQSGFFVGLGA